MDAVTAFAVPTSASAKVMLDAAAFTLSLPNTPLSATEPVALGVAS